ncbi:MAG TPA: (deoxy)nucleoside triphosphate pyrophosphohydrolase [Haliangium sp.]|nr:(deoxy)nucleoside triphosphate pyrophosphohydrolase [Haliangium sp.]
MRTRTLVVAGLITSADGQVLITQRRADQSMPLGWEFPGGKIEAGERPEQALARELFEELGVRAQVGRIWDVLFHPYETFDLLMLVYHCRLAPEQEVQCRQVHDAAWCRPGELARYDILVADRPLVERLIGEGLPDW